MDTRDLKGATPLVEAVASDEDASGTGEIAAVVIRLLLKAGANASHTMPNGLTPLFIAAQSGSTARCKAIWSGRPDVNAAPDSKVTPLHCAAELDMPEMATTFMDAGADTTVRRREDDCTAFLLAAKKGHVRVIQAMLGRDPTLTSQTIPSSKLTSLHLLVTAFQEAAAAQEGVCASISALLEVGGPALANALDNKGRCALEIAVATGQESAALLLLPHCEVLSKQKVLESANALEMAGVVSAVLQSWRPTASNARALIGGPAAATLPPSLFLKKTSMKDFRELVDAAIMGSNTMTLFRLMEAGANNSPPLRLAPSEEAVIAARVDDISLLKKAMAAGLSPSELMATCTAAFAHGSLQVAAMVARQLPSDISTQDRETLVTSALSSTREDAWSLLCSVVDPNTPLSEDDNALHHVVRRGMAGMVAPVVNAGVNALHRNAAGKTPLDVAAALGSREVLHAVWCARPAKVKVDDELEALEDGDCAMLMSALSHSILASSPECIAHILAILSDLELDPHMDGELLDDTLFTAVTHGNRHAVRLLLEHFNTVPGAKVLQVAVRGGFFGIARQLLSAVERSHSPALPGLITAAFDEAVGTGEVSVVALLLDDSRSSSNVVSAAQQAAMRHRHEHRWIENVNTLIVDALGAIRSGSRGQVRTALAALPTGGQFLRDAAHQDAPLLHILIEHDRLDASSLLPLGYDLTAVDSMGLTAFAHLVRGSVESCHQWLDVLTASRTRTEVAAAVLCARSGLTAFDVALKCGGIDCLQPLLDVVVAKRKDVPVMVSGDGKYVGGTAVHVAASILGTSQLQKFLQAQMGSAGRQATLQLVNSVCSSGKTPLMYLAEAGGNVASAQLLVDLGADVMVSDGSGCSALHYALQAKKDELACFLIGSMGGPARCNHPNSCGKTPWMLAAAQGLTASLRLLAPPPSERDRCDTSGATALMLACEAGSSECCNILLNELYVDAGFVSKGRIPMTLRNAATAPSGNLLPDVVAGSTAMHCAASTGSIGCMELLARAGVSVTDMNARGVSPAGHLLASGRREALDVLLRLTGGELLSGTAGSAAHGHLLCQAAASNEATLVFQLLAHGVPISSRDEKTGRTALHTAAMYSANVSAGALLSAGASLLEVDSEGRTALHIAVLRGATGVVSRMLVDPQAKAARNLQTKETAGAKTALHLAAEKGDLACVTLLLAANANVSLLDTRGETPLSACTATGRHHQVARALASVTGDGNVTGTMQTVLRCREKDTPNSYPPSMLAAASMASECFAPPLDLRNQRQRLYPTLEEELRVIVGNQTVDELLAQGRNTVFLAAALRVVRQVCSAFEHAGVEHVKQNLFQCRDARDIDQLLLSSQHSDFQTAIAMAAARFAHAQGWGIDLAPFAIARARRCADYGTASLALFSAWSAICSRIVTNGRGRLLLFLCERTEDDPASLHDLVTAGQALLDLSSIDGDVTVESLILEHSARAAGVSSADGKASVQKSTHFTVKSLICALKDLKERALHLAYPDKSLEEVVAAFQESSLVQPMCSEEVAAVSLRFTALLAFEKELADFSLAQVVAVAQAEGEALSDVSGQPTTDEEWKHACKLLAALRITVRMTFSLKPYTTQLFAILGLLDKASAGTSGRIAQIRTGEGKTLTVAIAVAFLALCGRTVDIVTSSQYLAERDAVKLRPFFELLGAPCSHICVPVPEAWRFDSPIIYGTNTDFEFALLRRMLHWPGASVRSDGSHRPADAVIVDEVDNLFLDTASSPARLATASHRNTAWMYAPLLHLVQTTENNSATVSEARNCLNVWADGRYSKTVAQLADEELAEWLSSAKSSLKFQRDVEYIIRDGAVVIMDHANTGQLQEGSRWSKGIHEFVEAREGIEPQSQSLTSASLSHPSFFSKYRTIFGVTGTMGGPEERKEVEEVYGTTSFDVPTHRPRLLEQLPVHIELGGRAEYVEGLRNEVTAMTDAGRPVLIICQSLRETREVAGHFRKEGMRVQLLNKVQAEDEELVILRAGEAGAVTIATNAAGRGTDIRLTAKAVVNGGLCVFMTFFPANLRVQEQGMGRAGRQGQPGSAKLYLHATSDQRIRLLVPLLGQLPSAAAGELIEVARANEIRSTSAARRRLAQAEMARFRALDAFAECLCDLKRFCVASFGALQEEDFLLEQAPMLRALVTSEEITGGHSERLKQVQHRAVAHLLASWAKFFTSLCESRADAPAAIEEHFATWRRDYLPLSIPTFLAQCLR